MYEQAATVLRGEAGCGWDDGGCMTLAQALADAAVASGRDPQAHVAYLLDADQTVQHAVAAISGTLYDAQGTWAAEELLQVWSDRAGAVDLSDDDPAGTAPPVYDAAYAAVREEAGR